MKTVSAMTMRRHFGGLLDDVRLRAEQVVIERDGKPVAMLTPLPVSTGVTAEQASRQDALKRLCGLSPATSRGHDPDRWLKKERAGWSGRER